METLNHARETEYQSLCSLMKAAEGEGGTAQLLSLALQEELTERQAQMVRMYYIEQHTMQDIAQTLGVNCSTVSRTLKTARVKLRRCLKYTSRALLHTDATEW
ncbi:MAG: sigma-70 family RNA polymerase sigma factor [Oscillospiraceae bacterium]|nr:sigma-70 family RNA polymerase sigma factor [Oscillospiraceae bacterium]